VGYDDEGMFAGKVGIDEKRGETVRRRLSPGDMRELFVHLHCLCGRRQKEEQKNEIDDAGL